MKTIKQILQIVITLLCLSSVLNAQKDVKLKVGDSAPGLQISKWLRGEPVPEFKKEDNRVYIVYFNGTWCPSCVKSIPYLTELQKKYDDHITLVSVYMEYSDSDEVNIKKVTNLMEVLGDRMDFTIAVDVPQSSRATWGLRGPAIFIVRAGTIIWRGSSSELDPVLEQLAAGTFDAVVAQYEQQEFKERLNNIRKAKAGGDFQSALAGIDQLIKETEVYNPARLPSLYYKKFEILAGDDDKGAYKWLQWLLDLDTKEKVQGFDWPYFVSMFHKISPENRHYGLELKAIDRTIEELEIKDRTANLLSLKASTYDQMGNYRKAVEMIRQAINVTEESGRTDKGYKQMLAVYTYKVRVKEEGLEKANTWLHWEIVNNKKIQSYSLIWTVMEVDHTFALQLIDKAPPELNKRVLTRYKYRILTRENSKKANTWLREELDNPKVKIITPELVDVVTKISNPDYAFALDLVEQGLQDLSDKNHYMRGEYFIRKAAIYAATGDFTWAVTASENAIDEYKEQGNTSKVEEVKSLLAEYQSKL